MFVVGLSSDVITWLVSTMMEIVCLMIGERSMHLVSASSPEEMCSFRD